MATPRGRFVNSRRRVNWKNPDEIRDVKRPQPLRHPRHTLSQGDIDKYMVHLIPGALFTLKIAMTEETIDPKYYTPHELNYLMPRDSAYFYSEPRSYPAGTLAVYMGQVRVEEERTANDVVRVPRHVFLVDGMRFMTTDIYEFVPVQSGTPFV